jgi:hypothetical protein
MSSDLVVWVLSIIQYFFGAASIITAFSKAVMFALVFLAFYNLFSVFIKKVKAANKKSPQKTLNIP